MFKGKNTRRSIVLLLFILAVPLGLILTPHMYRLLYPLHYREMIVKHSGRHNLEPQLVAAVIHAESRFNSAAESNKGARGLMQLMPLTGEWVAGQMGMDEFSTGKLFDPVINITLGTWYLQDLHRTFNNNTYAALAAYNGGRGHVRRWLQDGVWDGSLENIDDIPFPETRVFVMRVKKAYQRYHQLYDAETFELSE